MKNDELETWCERLADRIAKLENNAGLVPDSINEDDDAETAQLAHGTEPPPAETAQPPAETPADPGESPD